MIFFITFTYLLYSSYLFNFPAFFIHQLNNFTMEPFYAYFMLTFLLISYIPSGEKLIPTSQNPLFALGDWVSPGK